MTEAEHEENARAIEQLKTTLPVVVPARSGWAKARKIAQEISLVVGVVALLLGVYVNHEQGQTAQCVNNVLATRGGPADKDTAAHLLFAQALSDLLTAPKAQQLAKYQHFQAVSKQYSDTLIADQNDRAKHPLGKC